jgi:predicted lactoylglutathione lyase
MRPAEAPLANVITLGALDFTRLRGFYRALGWPQVVDDEDFAAFELRGIVLALFAAERLAGDGRTDADLVHSGIRSTIAVMASRRTEVDELVERMRVAGAVVTKEPTDAEFFDGRSAYLADPEGNYWEIAWAPDDNPIVAAAKRAASERPPERQRH